MLRPLVRLSAANPAKLQLEKSHSQNNNVVHRGVVVDTNGSLDQESKRNPYDTWSHLSVNSERIIFLIEP
jgi:hypothetical protein